MRLSEISNAAMNPAFYILPRKLDNVKSRVLMLAIGLQESRFQHRYQIVDGGGKGPARGFWQFERGTQASRGGVWGVYLHSASATLLQVLCTARQCAFDPMNIWTRIETDDVLAAGLARLLILTDAAKLPELGDVEGAWDLYANRCWRPGKPHRKTWDAFYAQALQFVTEGEA